MWKKKVAIWIESEERKYLFEYKVNVNKESSCLNRKWKWIKKVSIWIESESW